MVLTLRVERPAKELFRNPSTDRQDRMASDKSDRNYDTKNLNKVFALGSLVLLAVVLGMVLDDYSR